MRKGYERKNVNVQKGKKKGRKWVKDEDMVGMIFLMGLDLHMLLKVLTGCHETLP
jgi:hypothetical protein